MKLAADSPMFRIVKIEKELIYFRTLGSLNNIHIWHDNTGRGSSSSWFLKYIIVRDLQTMKKFHFICQKWLAVEKDDGKVNLQIEISFE
jgi:hypothetical protein